MKQIEVAVGVILRGDKVFISKRDDALHQGGKWEFPGGKREADESISEALGRELLEEIGIHVTRQTSLMVIEHNYPDKQVRLDVRIVDAFEGEPRQLEGQVAKWVGIDELNDYTFPEANLAIIERLQRPD